MTPTAAPTVKDQELISSGFVESESVNLINDCVPSKLNEKLLTDEKKKNDFINTFICHLIFYAIFCISLALHIIIDLGLGYLIKQTFIHLIELSKNFFVEKNPAFA